jgi:glutamate-5-semialdehyde dehydrogenase
MNIILEKIGENAKIAFQNKINNKKKNQVLNDYINLILKNQNKILIENEKDVKIAKSKKLKENLIKRLALNNDKISSIVKSIKTIAKFKDPINVDLETWKRPNGLKMKKVSIPIGIIGVIYESRPNVTSDVSTLCFKSGNCVILRGGSEAYFSNKILANLFRKSLEKNRINKNFVQFVENKNRKLVDYMLSKMSKYIDVIIPRGGKNLVKKVQNLSSVPVIGHLEGMCHTYIDKDANLKMAKKILINAKMRNTSICGATETLLIHKSKSKNVNEILNELTKRGCSIYADKKIHKLFNGNSKLANNKTWSKEHLSAKISVKLVDSITDAVNHINKYGTMHTDAIITNNKISAKFFIKNIKSSIAIHNSSTQYADGGEFGFGGEVGISTNKLPPRGPVGLNQLVSYKYEIYGSGQTRK